MSDDYESGVRRRAQAADSDSSLAGQEQVRRPEQRAENFQPAIMEISRLMGEISTELAAQQESVQFVADAVTESRQNVRQGTRELEKALERPSFMKEFVITFIIVMTILLVFLDWFSP